MYMEPEKIIEAVQGAVQDRKEVCNLIDQLVAEQKNELVLFERQRMDRMERAARNLEAAQGDADERSSLCQRRILLFEAIKEKLNGKPVDTIIIQGSAAPAQIEWAPPTNPGRTRRFFHWLRRWIW